MKIGFFKKFLNPKLDTFSPQEKKLIFSACNSRLFRSWQFWLSILIGEGLSVLGDYVGWHRGTSIGLGVGLAIVIFCNAKLMNRFLNEEIDKRKNVAANLRQ